MTTRPSTPLLDTVNVPADMKRLSHEQLRQLADELRTEMIDTVSTTGGHLGAGLGVIELTVALHYVFNTPDDRLIWDVGHQAYPHKILTGRRDRIRTLRQGGGLSGFTKRTESEYDPFGAAHSSTSISAAIGFAVANNVATRVESANAYLANAHPGCMHDCIFLVCDACGRATHVDDDQLTARIRATATASGFRPEKPVIEVRGRCAACV